MGDLNLKKGVIDQLLTFFALLTSKVLLSRLLWVLVFDLFYCPKLLRLAQCNKFQILSEIGLDRNKFVQLTLFHHRRTFLVS